MKQFTRILAFVLVSACASVATGWSQPVLRQPIDSTRLEELDNDFTFLIANDLGRNGYYDQKPVAEMMGQVAEITGTNFVAALGDVHHFMGVASVNDPLWLTNYELIYSHPSLMIPWYPVLGNHEYKGNTTAVLNYSKVSRRWQMPSRYYSKTFSVSDSVKVLILFIDTTPLIEKYRKDRSYEAYRESSESQLRWIDSTLSHSTAKWKIVMGHHPVYAGTTKSETEQTDLQLKLKPILEKYKTDLFICGHIHIFEHMKIPGSGIDYIVNASGSLGRPVVKDDGILYSSPDPGFLICSVKDSSVIMTLVNKYGKILYQYTRTK